MQKPTRKQKPQVPAAASGTRSRKERSLTAGNQFYSTTGAGRE